MYLETIYNHYPRVNHHKSTKKNKYLYLFLTTKKYHKQNKIISFLTLNLATYDVRLILKQICYEQKKQTKYIKKSMSQKI